jgi:outer membrane protein OmpA-like peptidoglycan-associated protein
VVAPARVGYGRAVPLDPAGYRVRTPQGEVRLRAEPCPSGPPPEEERALLDAALFALTAAFESGSRGATLVMRALLHDLGVEDGIDDGVVTQRDELSSQRLEYEARFGTLRADRVPPEVLVTPTIELPSIPPAPPEPESPGTFFDVRFVDETGQAIASLPVVFELDGEAPEVTTNPAGVAHLDHPRPASATISVVESADLDKILHQRWTKFRPQKAPKEGNTTEVVFEGQDVGPIAVKPAVSNRVLIKPPLGAIFMELWDKGGRVRHGRRSYTLAGPMPLEGTTDEQGRLRHTDVFPGDYTLTLDVDTLEEDGSEGTVSYDSPAVVLSEAAPAQVRMLGIAPDPALVRLRGLVFDRNKTFVKPGAVEVFGNIRELCESYDGGSLLIVGHTDTTGEPSINDPLSLARAKSVEAYLKGDVDTWLQNYDQQGKGKWGNREDQQMLLALPDADPDTIGAERELGPNPTGKEAPDDDLVTWFQRTRGLTVDGVAGPETRRRLVTEYMELDGISLPGDDFSLEVVVHGCGENFPLDDSGEELDARPAVERDDESDLHDRRVELFFFDAEFGIVPKPPGQNSKPGSTQYPAWRQRARVVDDFEPASALTEAKLIEMEDALFRTNSAVLMPEGEQPSSSEHGSTNGIGIIAAALRFNEEQAPKKLLIAGHTDTEASAAFNRPLSRERAELTFTLLAGKRDRFAELADARHKVADYKQILSWCSFAIPDTFTCDPGDIDDDATSGVEAVQNFQSQYNAGKEALGCDDQPDLVVDGIMGPATWRAIFDVYERDLRDELGVDAEGLADLRSHLRFLADDVRHVGFGESHPIEEPKKDQFRSQTNRRVELLFFGPGEEPDIDVLRNDPESSEVYDAEIYDRSTVAFDFPISDVVISPLRVFLLDEQRKRMGADPSSPDATARVAGAPYRITFPSGEVRVGYADKDGMLTETDVPDFESCTLEWGARDGNDSISTEASASSPDDLDNDFGLPETAEDAEAFFLYRGTLILRGARGAGRILDFLANMGHRGNEAARRREFSEFYSASDNGLVASVHGTGRPAPTG